MAHFRGTVKGGRGEGSRLGHANTGLVTYACGWNGKICTQLSVRNGVDTAYVALETNERTVVIYNGPLDKYEPKTPWVEVPWKVEPVSLTSEVTNAKE